MTAVTAPNAAPSAISTESERVSVRDWWSDTVVYAGRNIEHIRQIRRQRRGKTVRLAVQLELEARRVQEQSAQAEIAQRLVEFAQAVLFVAGQRVPGVLRMHADLVRAPGIQSHLGETGIRVVADHLERGQRRLAIFAHPHHALAAL